MNQRISTLLFNSLQHSTQITRQLLPTVTTCRHINLKPKLKEFINCDYQDNMDYGIYALTTGYIKESAIEAGRISIVRKSQSREVTKIACESPFTKKPVGTRMGKGKGKVSHWAAKAVAGQVLFEFNCANDSLAKEAFRQVKAKMPVRVHLRVRPRETRTVLSGETLLQMFEEHETRNNRLGLDDTEPFPS